MKRLILSLWVSCLCLSCAFSCINRFSPRSVEAVRLVITESKARPCIKEFAIFNADP
jgi:hypothetical protein